MTSWPPTRETLKRPVYRSLVDTVIRTVENGELAPGTRLPTHRDLAQRLGISIQTVSRAYEELIRRGLVVGEVGRGTFVRPGRREAMPPPVVAPSLAKRIDLPPPAFDSRPVPRRVGLILLATDHTTERDFARLCRPDEIGLYANRIAYENPTTPENLFLMQPRLTAGAALILPGESLDALYYACTAASVVIGDAAVQAAVQAAKSDVPVITPSGAARAAFHSLGVRRISILTPYLPDTSATIAAYFQAYGLEIANLACFGLDDDREMARVSPATILAAACDSMAPEADALFISCTALRAAEVAGEIERRIGKPVVTSNQAGTWLTLRRAGVERPIEGHGRLLLMPAPQEETKRAARA